MAKLCACEARRSPVAVWAAEGVLRRAETLPAAETGWLAVMLEATLLP